MADFVAVLRKTLDGMGETTPATLGGGGGLMAANFAATVERAFS